MVIANNRFDSNTTNRAIAVPGKDIEILLTPDQYRRIEETGQERHEYADGRIMIMPGGSDKTPINDKSQLSHGMSNFSGDKRQNFPILSVFLPFCKNY
jgi:hypothetical protein